MSYSLEFCKQRASNPDISSYADRDWSGAVEHDIITLLDNIICGARNYKLTGHLDDDEVSYDVHIVLDPDADFDYFTSDSFISDGTLLFWAESIDALLRKVLTLSTYNKELGKPPNGCTVNWIIGNAVSCAEYDGDWVPEDKKWMRERTTILLPLKVWYTNPDLVEADRIG